MPYFFRFKLPPARRKKGSLLPRIRPFVYLAFSLFMGLDFVLGSGALAENTRDLKQAIDQQKSDLNKTRAAQDTIKKQLNATQSQLDQTEKAQATIEARIETIKAQQSNLEQQTEQLNDDIKRIKETIGNNLRVAYLLGNQAPIATLLSHDNALSSERELYYIKTLVAQSINQLKTLKQTEQAQAQNTRALEHTQVELNAAQSQLATALNEHRAQLAKQNKLLKKISQQANAQSRRLAQLLAQKKELDDQIAALNAKATADHAKPNSPRRETAPKQSNSSANTSAPVSKSKAATDQKSQGGIPITGRIIRSYGASIAEGDMRSQGILFSAPTGTPVRSVAAGKVVFADRMKGWGNLVILRHAHGYLSLYAHNSELKVQTGMRVKKGALLGLSGAINGRQTGIYFEVRKGDDTINPLRWAPYRSMKR